MDLLLDSLGPWTLRTLLFLYFFVGKSVAECPRPQGNRDMVLSDQALLMNEFPDGSDVTLRCANGYDKQSGSGTMSCVDQKWTEPDLVCKKKDCGLPPAQPHMHFDAKEGTLLGATLEVYCDKGYQISGSRFKQCYPFGWSGRATCEIATCDAPPKIPNGRGSWVSRDDPQYGDVVVYQCNDGFTLVGESSITCTDSGAYNSSAPECRAVPPAECPRPQENGNMVLSPEAQLLNEFPDGSEVTLVCANGYVKESGSGTMSCVGQTWTEPDLVCKITTCEAPPKIQNGRRSWVSQDDPQYGDHVVYQCNEGLTLVGEFSIMCTDTGKYNSSAPECRDVPDQSVNTKTLIGVILGIVGVLVILFLLFILIKMSQRRKGSYDTREDLKPEALQFTNL